MLGHDIYTTFQNGVGPQGQPSSDGNTETTIVEFTLGGRVVRQWDLHGKCDGITADTARHLLYATVNEDANSSIYSITAGAVPGHQVVHSRYNVPLPHDGGTDAVSIWDGKVLISASAPGTTGQAAPQPSYPAVYSATFDPCTKVATVKPLFDDEAVATCPGPGFPPNFLGQLNPWTGKITKVDLRGPSFGPQGMVFIGPGWNVMPG